MKLKDVNNKQYCNCCEMAVGWLLRTSDGDGDIHVNASEYISKAKKKITMNMMAEMDFLRWNIIPNI